MSLGNLNFDRAEFASDQTANCVWCTRGLDGTYFDVLGAHVCGVCAERARATQPEDTRQTFLRSLLYGVMGGSLAGVAYFLLCRAISGVMIFAAIGVGYFVGKAMRVGSHGVGGRRYQVAAALLTYAAVAVASAAAIIGPVDAPAWVYPLLIFSPLLYLFTHHADLAALQALFISAGASWAWRMMAGRPWRITGPHSSQAEPATQD